MKINKDILSFNGYIFDFDGVIMDTEKYHYLSWKEAFRKYDMNLDSHVYETLKSSDKYHIINVVSNINQCQLNEDEALDIINFKHVLYNKYANSLGEKDFIPGIINFLVKLKSEGKKIGCVSSSVMAKRLLAHFNLIYLFDVVLDGTDKFEKKPSPEGYLKVIKTLDLNKEDIVIFEDSFIGLKSARDSGAYVVYVGKSVEIQSDFIISDFKTFES